MKRIKDKITPRERDVIIAMMCGLTDKEIGLQLGISPRTVEAHIGNVIMKVAARNRVNMAALVILKAMVTITIADLQNFRGRAET